MARPTEWRRVVISDDVGAFVFAAQLAELTEGSTIGRVRLSLQLSHTTDTFPGEWSPYPCVWGLSTTDASATEPDVDPIADASSENWLWWESITWRTHFLDTELDPAFELISGPLDGGSRDIQAQRGPADSAGLKLWFSFRWEQPPAVIDLEAFTMLTASTLVILP